MNQHSMTVTLFSKQQGAVNVKGTKKVCTQEIPCHYLSTSIFTVVPVCSLRTWMNTQINQSSMVATMMQQTATTTKLIIIQTYQLLRIKSVSLTVNNELIEKQSKEGWAKGVWMARRSADCYDERVRKVFLAMWVIMWWTSKKSVYPRNSVLVLEYQYFYCSTSMQSKYTNKYTN